SGAGTTEHDTASHDESHAALVQVGDLRGRFGRALLHSSRGSWQTTGESGPDCRRRRLLDGRGNPIRGHGRSGIAFGVGKVAFRVRAAAAAAGGVIVHRLTAYCPHARGKQSGSKAQKSRLFILNSSRSILHLGWFRLLLLDTPTIREAPPPHIDHRSIANPRLDEPRPEHDRDRLVRLSAERGEPHGPGNIRPDRCSEHRWRGFRDSQSEGGARRTRAGEGCGQDDLGGGDAGVRDGLHRAEGVREVGHDVRDG
ncbi:unnamed protein product, partial [Mycena citricolor]